jgi:hypothetical protein
MRRDQLEHLLRAAGGVTGLKRFVVIGSQSILGWLPTKAPAEALQSMEADLLPIDDETKADFISGALGEMSSFDETFGYHADGVTLQTATLPEGWQNRLKRIKNANTMGVSGDCLEPHDLLVAKYVAGREKDRFFCKALAKTPYVAGQVVLQRLQITDIPQAKRDAIISLIFADFELAPDTKI